MLLNNRQVGDPRGLRVLEGKVLSVGLLRGFDHLEAMLKTSLSSAQTVEQSKATLMFVGEARYRIHNTPFSL